MYSTAWVETNGNTYMYVTMQQFWFRNCVLLQMTCKEESFLLYSADLEEAKAWMETIEESVR